MPGICTSMRITSISLLFESNSMASGPEFAKITLLSPPSTASSATRLARLSSIARTFALRNNGDGMRRAFSGLSSDGRAHTATLAPPPQAAIP
jgi:hypothetical protein